MYNKCDVVFGHDYKNLIMIAETIVKQKANE